MQSTSTSAAASVVAARTRSASIISLQELDWQSHTQHSNDHRSPPSTVSWDSESPSLFQENDQDQSQDHDHETHQTPSEAHGAGTGVPPDDEAVREPDTAPSRPKPISRLAKFWAAHISCEVEMKSARDHLALERTFLGYLRTSLLMSIVGTLIAQLFTISHHDPGFGYTLIGKPLSTVCFSFSILTVLLGAFRTWRHQRCIMSGKALTGGFELHLIGIGTLLLVIVFFGFLLAIDVVIVDSSETKV
ncbi:hypothetical protein BGZ63DRAFT_272212 [Mariannaea sp. PMI_226]|nr:hypothetical protein BGZ63DRAFT_272212 [Mariannaea sp. PMI_226]